MPPARKLILLILLSAINLSVFAWRVQVDFDNFNKRQAIVQGRVSGEWQKTISLGADQTTMILLDAYESSPDRISVQVQCPSLECEWVGELGWYKELSDESGPIYGYELSLGNLTNPLEFSNTVSKSAQYTITLIPSDEAEYGLAIYHDFDSDEAMLLVAVYFFPLIFGILLGLFGVAHIKDRAERDWLVILTGLLVFGQGLLWGLYSLFTILQYFTPLYL